MENIVAEVNAYSNINRTQAINIPDIYEQFTIKMALLKQLAISMLQRDILGNYQH